ETLRALDRRGQARRSVLRAGDLEGALVAAAESAAGEAARIHLALPRRPAVAVGPREVLELLCRTLHRLALRAAREVFEPALTLCLERGRVRLSLVAVGSSGPTAREAAILKALAARCGGYAAICDAPGL